MGDRESLEVTENKERQQYATREVAEKPDWLRGSSWKSSGAIPSDRFDLGQMQDRIGFLDKGEPRCFGHSLSLPPDTGMCPGTTQLAEDPGVARHMRGATRPTFLNLAQWRRRVGSQIPTGFNFEADSGSEHSHGCLPRGGYLFGLNHYGGPT